MPDGDLVAYQMTGSGVIESYIFLEFLISSGTVALASDYASIFISISLCIKVSNKCVWEN